MMCFVQWCHFNHSRLVCSPEHGSGLFNTAVDNAKYRLMHILTTRNNTSR